MFNLESSISAWRSQMLAAGIQTPVPLEELEAHLREDIAEQIRAGTELQSAFENSIRRIGHARPLRAEFAKADESKYARPRKWLRVFFLIFAGCFLLWCVFGLARVEMSRAQRISGFVAVALNVLILASLSWFYRWSPVIPDRNTRQWLQAALTLFCPVFGGIAFRFIVPQLELTVGLLVNIVLWSIIPAEIFMGIAFGIGDAAHRPIPAKKFNRLEKYA